MPPRVSPSIQHEVPDSRKISGYPWLGVVVRVFKTLSGQTRVVVECTVPEVAGALHIYNEDQLERDKGERFNPYERLSDAELGAQIDRYRDLAHNAPKGVDNPTDAWARHSAELGRLSNEATRRARKDQLERDKERNPG